MMTKGGKGQKTPHHQRGRLGEKDSSPSFNSNDFGEKGEPGLRGPKLKVSKKTELTGAWHYEGVVATQEAFPRLSYYKKKKIEGPVCRPARTKKGGKKTRSP